MNYLEKKKKAMLNYVSGGQPSVTTQVTTSTSSTGSNPSLDITYDGVTTTINWNNVYQQVPKIIGNIIISYEANYYGRQYGWHLWAFGEVEFNGQTYHAGNHIAGWGASDTVDYSIVGTVQDRPIGSTQVYVACSNNQDSFLVVIDNNNNVIYKNNYTTYFNTTVARNLVDITYNTTDNWKFTANAPLKYNGTTYQVGEVVTTIPYIPNYTEYELNTFEQV